jgi:hypothetical protein
VLAGDDDSNWMDEYSMGSQGAINNNIKDVDSSIGINKGDVISSIFYIASIIFLMQIPKFFYRILRLKIYIKSPQSHSSCGFHRLTRFESRSFTHQNSELFLSPKPQYFQGL